MFRVGVVGRGISELTLACEMCEASAAFWLRDGNALDFLNCCWSSVDSDIARSCSGTSLLLSLLSKLRIDLRKAV